MRRTHVFPVPVLLLVAIALLVAGPVAAQNPSSCTTSGYSGYSYTYVYDAQTNTTTYSFTFCNRSPINGIYANIGEIYFSDFPAPVGTPGAPPGWEFLQIGPKLFFATTSNPWWQTPPAIKPGDCLSGFTYTISGMPDTDFIIFTHVQAVTDATGQTSDTTEGSWFDCSVEVTLPQNEPCISIIKTADPVQVESGGSTTYTYEVCNCGNVPLTVTSLDDDHLGDLLDELKTANSGSDQLGIGDCVEFDVPYDIQPGDPNPLINCVEVNAEDDEGTKVDGSACATVFIITVQPGPCIDLVKTVDPEQAEVGQLVTYKYRICNCGNADLTITSLTDSNPLVNAFLATWIADQGGSIPLAVGECVETTVGYVISGADPSPLFNCALVTAVDPTGAEVQKDDCARVDIALGPILRQCFRPVTFTQELWHQFGETGNGVFPNGVMYGRFYQAFATHVAYGRRMPNCMMLGDPTVRGGQVITFDGSALGIARLCEFLPQTGPACKLSLSYHNPVCLDTVPGVGVTNSLAGEIAALTLNIAFNDARCMPRHLGYDLEKFTLASGRFRGKKVGEVLNIANCVLSGVHPVFFGLPTEGGCECLAGILRTINSNYAFLGFDDYVDRGWLRPNRPFGSPDRAHCLTLPVPTKQ